DELAHGRLVLQERGEADARVAEHTGDLRHHAWGVEGVDADVVAARQVGRVDRGDGFVRVAPEVHSRERGVVPAGRDVEDVADHRAGGGQFAGAAAVEHRVAH